MGQEVKLCIILQSHDMAQALGAGREARVGAGALVARARGKARHDASSKAHKGRVATRPTRLATRHSVRAD